MANSTSQKWYDGHTVIWLSDAQNILSISLKKLGSEAAEFARIT